jgi:hypothetical protein
MPTVVDKTACSLAADGQESGLLPVSPFTAIQYNFGMLLGVDDLETAQAYPRGKDRLHNAWLHREGVVWGFNVSFNVRNELVVDPGLALDAAGHELHLDRQACLDLGQWYAANKDDKSFTFADVAGGGKEFSIHVVAKFKACLTRPVPAIADPCDGAGTDTAYSRVFETIELLLRPGLSQRGSPPYRRLRILFSLEDDSDPKYQVVRDRRAAIQAMPVDHQPKAYLAALRDFAALDEIDLAPQHTPKESIFPADPTELVLADIDKIIVIPTATGAFTISAPIPVPDVRVRSSHIATVTIQELLCGPLFTGLAAPGPPPPSQPPAAPGPKVTGATLGSRSLTFTTDRPLAASTLDPQAFSVTGYNENDGWNHIDVRTVAAQADGSIAVVFREAPAGTFVRFIARGTGPTPLLGADFVPLGAPGAGGADDGIDFVKMFKRS